MNETPHNLDELLGEPSESEHPRRRRNNRPMARVSLNLTPMIDVVFQLLIYFILATKFTLGEEIYRMDLPQRQPSSAERDPFQLDLEPLRVEVTSLGLGPGDYAVRLDGPYNQPDTFDDLYNFLLSRQIGEGSFGGLFEVDHPIIIIASPTTRWEHVMEAFNAVARARYNNIMFSGPRQ